jgi:MFS family permease
MKNPSRKALFVLIYLVSFLYSFHYGLPLYIDSSFIGRFVPAQDAVGLIFAIAAVFTTIFTFLFPRMLCKIGSYRSTLITMGLEVVVLVSLAFSTNANVVIPLFISYLVLTNLIFLNLDILIESFSDDARTGGIRGTFMTVLNVAIAIAPFIAGFMLTDHDFWKVYLAAAGVMFLGFLIIAKNFRNHPTPPCTIATPMDTWHIIRKNNDLRSIIILHFLLAFFYAWMVIYTPVYLNIQLGIPMNTILSVIIPIALIPFIFLEIILGKIADARLDEKELLLVGFALMAISTGALAFVSSVSVVVWSVALFITRVGASIVEVMTESYFYKHVGPGDVPLITFMRTIRAAAYVVGPIIGSIVLVYFEPRFLFLVLGIIMLFALPIGFSMNDTK